MTLNPDVQSIHQWLSGFSAAVRARDYVSGRDFFADEVIGFGSVAQRCDGLENLELNQWRKVWDVTTGFEFDLPSTVVGVDGRMAWAASAWQSTGKTPSGAPMLRRGRSTFVFRLDNAQWRAVHSHFSLEPQT